jgi:hypothetical protein
MKLPTIKSKMMIILKNLGTLYFVNPRIKGKNNDAINIENINGIKINDNIFNK